MYGVVYHSDHTQCVYSNALFRLEFCLTSFHYFVSLSFWKAAKFGKVGSKDDGSGFKAALLSGPPGVGKTTTAALVCEVSSFSLIIMYKLTLCLTVSKNLRNPFKVFNMGSRIKSLVNDCKRSVSVSTVSLHWLMR